MRTVHPAHSDPRVGVRRLRSSGSDRDHRRRTGRRTSRAHAVRQRRRQGRRTSQRPRPRRVRRPRRRRRAAKSCASRARPSRSTSRCSSTTARRPATRSRSSARRSRSSSPRWRRATTSRSSRWPTGRPSSSTTRATRSVCSDAVGRLFSMPQSGMTLLDAIVETSQGLARRETPRAVIVPVITDGIEFTNRYSNDVVAALERVDAALHIVGIGQFIHIRRARHPRALVPPRAMGPRRAAASRSRCSAHMALTRRCSGSRASCRRSTRSSTARPQSLIPPERTEVTSAKTGVTMRGAPARGESGA